MKKRKRGRIATWSTFRAGVIGAVVLIVITYLGFTKFANPFASPYTAHVIFSSANGLRPGSLVRIAGVNVGKVTGVSPVTSCKEAGQAHQQGQCAASDVELTIDDNGLPIHKDATFYIRPRIFLEGNFFVDTSPGSPAAPIAPSGWHFPIQQGIEPVQFDQFLGALQSNTRRNLQILLQQYGRGVKEGGPAYNSSIQYWLPAYEYSSIVAHDALGIRPHDLSGFIYKQGDISAALDAHPPNLANLVTDFNTTAAAFARENVALANAVHELPITLNTAIPAFNALNRAFPPLRAFARALLPGVQSTGPMVDASLPFITQLRLLVQPSELEGLVHDLSFTVPALANLTAETIPFMRDQVRPLSSCVSNEIWPWSQSTINDPNFNSSNGFPPRKAYIEAVDFLPGLAGESRDFDANGPYIRVLGTGGTFPYSATPGFGGAQLFPIAGTFPRLSDAPPGFRNGSKVAVNRPPLEPNVPCETQPAMTSLSPPGPGPTPAAGDITAAAAKTAKSSSASLKLLRDMNKIYGLGLTLPAAVQGASSQPASKSTKTTTKATKK